MFLAKIHNLPHYLAEIVASLVLTQKLVHAKPPSLGHESACSRRLTAQKERFVKTLQTGSKHIQQTCNIKCQDMNYVQ